MTQQTQINEDANEARVQTLASERSSLEYKIGQLICFFSSLHGDYVILFDGYIAFLKNVVFDEILVGDCCDSFMPGIFIDFSESNQNDLDYGDDDSEYAKVSNFLTLQLPDFIVSALNEALESRGGGRAFKISGVADFYFEFYLDKYLLDETLVAFAFDDSTDSLFCESYEALNVALDRYTRWLAFFKEYSTASKEGLRKFRCDSFKIFSLEFYKKDYADRIYLLCSLEGSLQPALRFLNKNNSEV